MRDLQEKYKRKKAKKYLTRVTPIRPTATSIAAAFFAKSPAKLGGLRGDSLAILLTLANVGAHCRALVVDCISGMVTGAHVNIHMPADARSAPQKHASLLVCRCCA